MSVTDPRGADVAVSTEAVQNNSFKIGFQPSQPGIYDANVYFGDQQVPGSPFKVHTIITLPHSIPYGMGPITSS